MPVDQPSDDRTPDDQAADASSPQPWYARTPVLLGIGAAVLVAALAFAVIGGDDDPASKQTAVTTSKGTSGDGSTPGPDQKVALTDVEAFEPEWIFRDPNRAIGDGSTSVVPATWLLDDRVIVMSADIIRAHSLDRGSVLWERPLKLDPCAAVAHLPADSEIIVIGEAERDSLCASLRAIRVDTGETVWTYAKAGGFTSNSFESVVAAPAGLFVLDNDGVKVLDPETGEELLVNGKDEIAERAAGSAADEPFFAPGRAAMDDKTGVVVVTGAVLKRRSDGPEPTYAVGFDAKSGKVLWTTQVSPERVDAVPQNYDPRFLLLGNEGDEVVKLDLKAGKVASRYAVPAQTENGRPNYEQFTHLGGPWYRTGTVPVEDDLVMVYEHVSADRDGSDDNLVRIDGATGKEIWRIGTPEIPEITKGESASLAITAGPLVDDTHLLATFWNRRRSWIALIDATSGKVVSFLPQPKEITNSKIQSDPALHVLQGGRLLMIYNPNGSNSADDPTEAGDDQTALILLRPAT
ncbi:MAG: PQQ-binding-like beta-propeller repeat protein [Aquihabitans sp.]